MKKYFEKKKQLLKFKETKNSIYGNGKNWEKRFFCSHTPLPHTNERWSFINVAKWKKNLNKKLSPSDEWMESFFRWLEQNTEIVAIKCDRIWKRKKKAAEEQIVYLFRHYAADWEAPFHLPLRHKIMMVVDYGPQHHHLQGMMLMKGGSKNCLNRQEYCSTFLFTGKRWMITHSWECGKETKNGKKNMAKYPEKWFHISIMLIQYFFCLQALLSRTLKNLLFRSFFSPSPWQMVENINRIWSNVNHNFSSFLSLSLSFLLSHSLVLEILPFP